MTIIFWVLICCKRFFSRKLGICIVVYGLACTKVGYEVSMQLSKWLLMISILFMFVLYVSVLSVWHITYVPCPWRSEEGTGSPQTGVLYGCSLPCGCWGLNASKSNKHSKTAEPPDGLHEQLWHKLTISFQIDKIALRSRVSWRLADYRLRRQGCTSPCHYLVVLPWTSHLLWLSFRCLRENTACFVSSQLREELWQNWENCYTFLRCIR